VHVGKKIPEYVLECVQQVRVFNQSQDCKLIFVCNQEAFNLLGNREMFDKNRVEVIFQEDLSLSKEHIKFIKNCQSRGLWRFSIERFFLIQEIMEQKSLSNVFHIECDNMLYSNLLELEPVCKENYNGLAIIFDSNKRAILSFMYIKDQKAIDLFAKEFSQNTQRGTTDMFLPRKTEQKYSLSLIDSLPLVSEDYAHNNVLKNNIGEVASNSKSFFNNFDKFNSIFDGAAIGQYLGGIDPIHPNNQPGFINETAFINPSKFKYEWMRDEKHRKVPYAVYDGKHVKINNLHIHCKRLEQFRS
jgi:hypothetical protein